LVGPLNGQRVGPAGTASDHSAEWPVGMETIELRINCGAVVEIPAAAHENFQFIWPCGARGSFSSASALAIKEHPMTFEEIDARAIELFSKLRPIEEWPYIDEGDRNYWRKEAGDELDEPLLAEACRLAAPLERREPEPLHLVEEPPQARVVIRKDLI